MARAATQRTAPTRRNVELALLLLATALVFVYQASVELALIGRITTGAFVLTGVFAASALTMHLAIRFLAPYADPVLLPVACALSGVGVVYLRRLSYTTVTDGELDLPTEASRAALGIFSGFGGRHLLYFAIAAVGVVAVLLLIRDHRALSRYAYTMGLAGVVLAAIPGFLPSSLSQGDFGANSWIRIGSFSVQPSEFAKLLLMGFFAYYLVRKREVLSLASKKLLGLHFPRLRDIVPLLVVCAASILVLVLESDLGSSLLYFGVFVAMLYIATQRASWVLIGLGMFALGAVAAHAVVARLQLRVRIWLDPWNPELVDNDSFQLVQSLIGLGSGGLVGAGPGKGYPQEIPIVESDFAISGLGEEIGLFGLAAVLMLYLVFVARGMSTALAGRDLFGKLLAAGLAFSVGFQVFVIIGGITRLIPMTGITAPFISAGGSSLVANWILTAVLLRISHDFRKPQAAPAGPIKVAPPPARGDDSPTQLVPAASNDATELVDVASVREAQSESGGAAEPEKGAEPGSPPRPSTPEGS